MALNFLGHLSGVATGTAKIADAIAHTGASVADTRKTIPGLRALQKHAVRAGGGSNHRFGLDDAVLIKDNHIAVAGGVTAAVRAAKAGVGHLVKIEVEVDSLAQLAELLEEGADAVLLDNMAPDLLREAVAMVAGRMITEASGRITPETAVPMAEAGVDLISVGWLTHSARVLDIASTTCPAGADRMSAACCCSTRAPGWPPIKADCGSADAAASASPNRIGFRYRHGESARCWASSGCASKPSTAAGPPTPDPLTRFRRGR